MPKFYKIVFFILLLNSTLITLSSHSWFLMWIGLEINMMAFIPLIFNSKSIYSSESILKYFMVQTLASTMLIYSFILLESNFYLSWNLIFNPSFMLTVSALLMKLGLAPFHFWFPEVAEGMSWFSCSLLLTWQKLAPMSILMMMMMNNYLIMFSIIMSSLLGGLAGLNQISLRKILVYSSMNHMAWMLLSMNFSIKVWTLYFFVYSLTNFSLIFIFSKMKTFSILQLSSVNFNIPLKLIIVFNMMSLAGLPPFIGFMPKWMTIYWSIMSMQMIIVTILIVSSLMTIYFYLQIIFPVMFLKNSTSILELKKSYLKSSFLMFNFVFIFSILFLSSIL